MHKAVLNWQTLHLGFNNNLSVHKLEAKMKFKEIINEKLESMITIYEKHIEELEKENKSLKLQIDFLKEQLSYKTFGKPLDLEEEE